jgi:Flp pilus assembly protein TadB
MAWYLRQCGKTKRKFKEKEKKTKKNQRKKEIKKKRRKKKRRKKERRKKGTKICSVILVEGCVSLCLILHLAFFMLSSYFFLAFLFSCSDSHEVVLQRRARQHDSRGSGVNLRHGLGALAAGIGQDVALVQHHEIWHQQSLDGRL